MPKLRTALTTKGQTTVPKVIRDQLGVGPHDFINWEMIGDEVRVTGGSPAFFRWFGAIDVGPGSVEEDIKLAHRRKARKIVGD
jgi:bifunctional DNA-binding transcriptional regulator/antitoxin component of YhaV-PrlF toxin-antitoxin module